MSNWSQARDGWNALLGSVEESRGNLECSYRNAWFRGDMDGSYPLLPKILRPRGAKELKRPGFDEMVIGHPKLHNEIAQLERRKASLTRQIAGLSNRSPLTNVDELRKTLDKQAKVRELKAYRDEADELQTQKKRALREERLLCWGEREAFHEFSFRSGQKSDSWEVLALMRHHEIPTRLLDWTEVFLVSVYFALGNYRDALRWYWNLKEDSRKLRKVRSGSSYVAEPEERPFTYIQKGELQDALRKVGGDRVALADALDQEPCITILNPYHCSQKVTQRRAIWDFTHDDRYDYARNFLVDCDWPWEHAVPMYSPWKSARIASQQGMFTVHGHSREPLDEQMKEAGVLTRITISPEAAIYGVKFLFAYTGIDRFALFRDSDSLGQRVTDEFLF